MPNIGIAFEGRPIQIEVEGSEYIRAQRDVGIINSHFESFDAWFENGRSFNGGDYAKISAKDNERILELLNGQCRRSSQHGEER